MLKYLLLLTILPILLIPIFAQEYSDNFPPWVKNNAGWWIDDSVYDNTFVQGIQFLMNNGFIPINTIPSEIPNPIKISTEKWIDDKITSQEWLWCIQKWLTLSNEELFECEYIALIITITTNQPSYTEGDTIYITGKTQNPTNGTSVSISLGLPDGTTSPISNVISSGANQFTTTIQTGNNTTVYVSGSYSLTAQYGNNTASTTFDYYNVTEEEELSLFTLSNHELSKWTHQLEKWENAQNRTDSSTERLELKLDRALTNNNTNQIIVYTERINNSMALSELYGVMIDSLQEQLDSYP